MWWTFFIIFLVVSLFSSITLYYAMKRINQYENIITQIQQIITFAGERMKVVDESGHYESDDETQFFFEQLRDMQTLLNGIFETEETEDAEKKK